MRNYSLWSKTFHFILLTAFFITCYGCSQEQEITNTNTVKSETKIGQRTGCTDFADLVKERVSERDHIPLEQIYGCYYYGPYPGGYCEYHCTTFSSGTPIYIIGDDSEGW